MPDNTIRPGRLPGGTNVNAADDPQVTNDPGANNPPIDPAAGGAVRVGEAHARDPNVVPRPGMVAVHEVEAGAHNSLFAVNGRAYPDTVGLPQLLRAMGNQPEARGAIEHIIGQFEQITQIPIPNAVKEQIIANPELLGEKLAVTPQQLSDALAALAQAHQAGAVPDRQDIQNKLPDRFDFADLANTEIAVAKPALKQLAPGIYQGDFPGPLAPDQAKTNIIVAEVFDRLAQNAKLDPGEKPFVVRFGGKELTRLDTFLAALEAAGYALEITFSHRVANFANIKTKRDDQPDSEAKHVPLALMVRTGIKDGDEEAVVPAAHAEMILTVKDSPAGMPKLDGSIKYYQGVSSTGFFPCDLAESHAWLGWKVTPIAGHETLQGPLAYKLAEIAGLDSDVINEVAKDLGLPADGYGNLGVCLNSVQRMMIVARLLLAAGPDEGKAWDFKKAMPEAMRLFGDGALDGALAEVMTYYPMLGDDDPITKELKERLGDRNFRDDPEYRLVGAAVASVHRDAGADAAAGDATRLRRILDSLPWAEGKEAFLSSKRARQIIEAKLAGE